MSVDDGLRAEFRGRVPKPVHWTTIESGFTERGIPDGNYCIPVVGQRLGAEGWVEFKASRAFEVALRPEQIGWLKTRARHGGRCFVAVRRRSAGGPRRGPPTDELWMFLGSAASELKMFGMSPVLNLTGELPAGAFLGRWEGGPGRWDWREVRKILVSRV